MNAVTEQDQIAPKGKPSTKTAAKGESPTDPPEEVVELVEALEAKQHELDELKVKIEKQDEDDGVMDLTSIIAPRKLIKLPTKDHPDGDRFELRLLDDFGIAMQQKLLSWSRRFDALFNESERDLTDDEQETMSFILNQLSNAILVAPDEVKKGLPDAIRARVVSAFSLAPLLARQEAEEKRLKVEEEEKERKEEAEEESKKKKSTLET